MTKIGFKKLNPLAVVPTYAHGPEEDAGMDLVSVETVSLQQYQPTLVKIGLGIELPPYVEAQIRPRSGLALKQGVTVYNSPGTVDPGYRGEIGVILYWTPTLAQVKAHLESRSLTPHRFQYEVKAGDKIAQMVIAPYLPVKWYSVASELATSERGPNGFGSTGV